MVLSNSVFDLLACHTSVVGLWASVLFLPCCQIFLGASMIRKLLWLWLVVGTLLMAAGIAHGQQQIIYRRGPLGLWERVAVNNPVGDGQAGQCYVAPDGRQICGGGLSVGATTAPAVPPTFAEQATPGSGTTPQGQGGQQAGKPSPVVVRIASSRGGITQYGTGTVIDVKGDVALIATCSHIFKAGYQIAVIYPEGTQVPGEILATDATHDAALVVCAAAGRLELRMADPPQPGSRVCWAGYGSGQYATGAGGMVRVDGDFLIVQGQPREGDSGGPIYLANGPMIGLLTEASQGPGEPWQISGPTSTWLATFVAAHWPPVFGAGLAGGVNSDASTNLQGSCSVSSQEAGSVGPLPPAGPAASDYSNLRADLADLRAAIEAMQLVPGPPGPQGPAGPPGKDAAGLDKARLELVESQLAALKAKSGPWYLRGIGRDGKEQLIAIEPGDKVRLLEPLNLSQVKIDKATTNVSK